MESVEELIKKYGVSAVRYSLGRKTLREGRNNLRGADEILKRCTYSESDRVRHLQLDKPTWAKGSELVEGASADNGIRIQAEQLTLRITVGELNKLFQKEISGCLDLSKVNDLQVVFSHKYNDRDKALRWVKRLRLWVRSGKLVLNQESNSEIMQLLCAIGHGDMVHHHMNENGVCFVYHYAGRSFVITSAPETSISALSEFLNGSITLYCLGDMGYSEEQLIDVGDMFLDTVISFSKKIAISGQRVHMRQFKYMGFLSNVELRVCSKAERGFINEVHSVGETLNDITAGSAVPSTQKKDELMLLGEGLGTYIGSVGDSLHMLLGLPQKSVVIASDVYVGQLYAKEVHLAKGSVIRSVNVEMLRVGAYAEVNTLECSVLTSSLANAMGKLYSLSRVRINEVYRKIDFGGASRQALIIDRINYDTSHMQGSDVAFIQNLNANELFVPSGTAIDRRLIKACAIDKIIVMGDCPFIDNSLITDGTVKEIDVKGKIKQDYSKVIYNGEDSALLNRLRQLHWSESAKELDTDLQNKLKLLGAEFTSDGSCLYSIPEGMTVLELPESVCHIAEIENMGILRVVMTDTQLYNTTTLKDVLKAFKEVVSIVIKQGTGEILKHDSFGDTYYEEDLTKLKEIKIESSRVELQDIAWLADACCCKVIYSCEEELEHDDGVYVVEKQDNYTIYCFGEFNVVDVNALIPINSDNKPIRIHLKKEGNSDVSPRVCVKSLYPLEDIEVFGKGYDSIELSETKVKKLILRSQYARIDASQDAQIGTVSLLQKESIARVIGGDIGAIEGCTKDSSVVITGGVNVGEISGVDLVKVKDKATYVKRIYKAGTVYLTDWASNKKIEYIQAAQVFDDSSFGAMVKKIVCNGDAVDEGFGVKGIRADVVSCCLNGQREVLRRMLKGVKVKTLRITADGSDVDAELFCETTIDRLVVEGRVGSFSDNFETILNRNEAQIKDLIVRGLVFDKGDGNEQLAGSTKSIVDCIKI